MNSRFQGSLFRRYVLYLGGLLCGALLASTCVSLWFSYRETRSLVDELQREKARSAATRIEQFLRGIETQARALVLVGRGTAAADLDRRQIELLRLLRIAPAVSEASWLDAAGIEHVSVSRVGRDTLGENLDRASDPGYIVASAGKVWYGPVQFRRQTEPHITLAIPGARHEDGIVVAVINLKFVFDVVAQIKAGRRGIAYLVDSEGHLISHPDASLVLRKTDLSDQPAVRTALANAKPAGTQAAVFSQDATGQRVLTAYAGIEAPVWSVLVEQPVSEAFASLYALALRTLAMLAAGIMVAIGVSLLLARRMVAPIRVLEAGAARIGDGRLDEPVVVDSGDELEALAGQFNRMAERLRCSYAELEQRIEERTRQLADANRGKSRFLAAASHDLRQPVHALGLFVAQLEEATDEDARRGLVRKVAAASAAVSELIEALLDISKLDAGVVEPRLVGFALQSLFDRVEHAFSGMAQEKGLRLRVRPTTLRVRSDPMLLERVLFNLCANAIRYTGRGGAIVTARARQGGVRIEVRDTGVGIPAEALPHIFEEFYQAAPSHAADSPGLGLGLAIVDRLGRLIGARVSVRSVAGRGSVFAVELPPAPAPDHADSQPADTGAMSRFDGMHVLLVDDDPRARDAAAGLLAGWGCVVRSAAGEADALRLLDQDGVLAHLIICDYQLGTVADGIALVSSARAAAGRQIAAVIISADAGSALREAAATADLHVLQKPLNAARLRAFLQYVASEATIDPAGTAGA